MPLAPLVAALGVADVPVRKLPLVLKGFIVGARTALVGDGTYIGFEVAPEPDELPVEQTEDAKEPTERADTGRTQVIVNLLVRSRSGAAETRQVWEGASASPEVLDLLDPDSRALFEGLTPEDRRRILDQIPETMRLAFYPIDVELEARGSSWVIVDAGMADTGIRLSTAASTVETLAEAGIVEPPPRFRAQDPRSPAFRMGQKHGRVLFVVLVLGAVFVLWRVTRPRRRPPGAGQAP